MRIVNYSYLSAVIRSIFLRTFSRGRHHSSLGGIVFSNPMYETLPDICKSNLFPVIRVLFFTFDVVQGLMFSQVSHPDKMYIRYAFNHKLFFTHEY